MNHTPYIERTYRKYDHVLERYAEHIFCPISSAQDVYALETMEHYRNPPAVSKMKPIKPGTE